MYSLCYVVQVEHIDKDQLVIISLIRLHLIAVEALSRLFNKISMVEPMLNRVKAIGGSRGHFLD